MPSDIAWKISLVWEILVATVQHRGTQGSNHVQVTVRLFALAKQIVGRSELPLQLPESATVVDLRQELARAYPKLAPLVPNLMIAIDSEYADDTRVIQEGEEVALIPPVSGGGGLNSKNFQAATPSPQKT